MVACMVRVQVVQLVAEEDYGLRRLVGLGQLVCALAVDCCALCHGAVKMPLILAVHNSSYFEVYKANTFYCYI